jgi:hypothetical protein
VTADETLRPRQVFTPPLVRPKFRKANSRSASRGGTATRGTSSLSHPNRGWICGRSPADAHRLRFTQPRAMGRHVSDEFTVPLCRTHHRDNHSSGDELAWWERRAIDPVATSRILWVSTRRIE